MNDLEIFKELVLTIQKELDNLKKTRQNFELNSKVWLSADEVYSYLNTSEATLNRWVQNGLPYYQVGAGKRYFKRAEIDNFLESNQTVNEPLITNTLAANAKIRQIMATK